MKNSSHLQASCWGLPWHSGLGSQGSDPWGVQRRRVAARAEAGGEVTPAAWSLDGGPGGWREPFGVMSYCYILYIAIYIFSMNPYGPMGSQLEPGIDFHLMGIFMVKTWFIADVLYFLMVDNIPRWCNPPDI